ncbi:MAG: hypothetical protein RLN62_07125 [Rickettsiales bacterium]
MNRSGDNIYNLKQLVLNYLPLIQEITTPLKYIGIRTFSYYLISKEMEAIYFANDLEWLNRHYDSNDGMTGLGRCILFADEKYTLNKIVYSGNPNYDLFAPNKPMNGSKMFENNLWNACCFYEKNDDGSYESFNFFAGNDRIIMPEIYKKHEDKFRKFMSYFRTSIWPILNNLDNKRFFYGKTDARFSYSRKILK